jgi:cytochrome bd ubiquinol oxidase subunit I
MDWLPLADAFSQVNQPYLFEARQMQALSLGVHIPLVCFGVAFPAIVLFMEGLYHRTGNLVYRQIAKRWSKVMLILFAVGVVTGTILSFELGLLWPRFMEEFGDVFGVAFALEGLSFFIEAIFITIYVYGWDKLPDRTHFLTGIPIVITGLTGSFLVISVNGWMNNPTGFDIDAAGNVTNVEPLKALFNDYFWHEFFHMYVAGFIVAAFLVAGVYAHAWLKGNRSHYYRAALVVPLTVAAIAAPVQLLMGDWAGRAVAEQQPVKLAAFEGLEETTKGAPFNIGGIYIDGENRGGVTIPDMLSILAFHDPNATVEGLNSVPEDEQPPVGVVRNSFTVMVMIGSGLALLSALYLITWFRKGRLPRSKWFYRLVIAAGPGAFVALIAGWITTEVGRQPWIVYGVMKTEEAVTGAEGIPIGYATLAAVYLGLAAIVFFLLRRLAKQPLEHELPGAGTGMETRA